MPLDEPYVSWQTTSSSIILNAPPLDKPSLILSSSSSSYNSCEARLLLVTPNFRGSNLEGGLKGFENVVKRTFNSAYRSPRYQAVTKHPMKPPPSSIISL